MKRRSGIVDISEPVRRTSEIEEITNLHVIHPISSYLTLRFARLGITPNAVSISGMASGMLAGLAYHQYRDPRCAVAGFALMVVWHVLDGADGQLARLTNSQSHTGKILDGICDYVTFIAVYCGLALALARDHGTWVWAVVALAGLCHAVQSAAYEMQRQEYNFWGWGRGSSTIPKLAVSRRSGPGDVLFRVYARVQHLTARGAVALHRRLSAALAAHPDRAAMIRLRYRQNFAPLVRRWSILSANYRTIGVFVCVLARMPLLYFGIEIVGLSLILLALMLRQRAGEAAFGTELAALEQRPGPVPTPACV
ncbi:CDP-alcohol phosphatidyltransferase family protein [Gluconacetobacter azotocaptans]|nr:CDP-alcohol phosphatidyltransferase family protein [Gluconacetobacter azotocaptans]MBM9401629.1 CDP-alcohol phosphatidyltransferase family protein [Gluconacetobacter azotocaptans]